MYKEIDRSEFNSIVSEYYLTTKNPQFQKALDMCHKVASSNANLLLSGESGTGKEVFAQLIHHCSKRSSQPFVPVNCSSLSDTLIESELFGHEQGSFTGATSSKPGKFELANRGTLFLDEVGDISLTTQTKLLRTLETKKLERIGSTKTKEIDFRLISATNVDLKSAIFNQLFREDFFYRISTIVIRVPALREHREDLPDLIDFFIKKSSAEHGIEIKGMAPSVENFLYSYEYYGNIRELRNIIDRMVVLSDNGIITPDGIPVMFSYRKSSSRNFATPLASDIQKDAGDGFFISCPSEILSLTEFRRQSEKEYIEWVFSKVGNNVAEASRQLNISTRQLFNKIKELDVKRK